MAILPPQLGRIVGVVVGPALLLAICHPHGDAWLFTGLTFSMVAILAIQATNAEQFSHFAGARLEEVACSPASCWYIRRFSSTVQHKRI